LTDEQIEAIERSNVRPCWVPQAVGIYPAQHVINVLGLYWGVFHLIRLLAQDESQMKAAEERIREGRIVQ